MAPRAKRIFELVASTVVSYSVLGARQRSLVDRARGVEDEALGRVLVDFDLRMNSVVLLLVPTGKLDSQSDRHVAALWSGTCARGVNGRACEVARSRLRRASRSHANIPA